MRPLRKSSRKTISKLMQETQGREKSVPFDSLCAREGVPHQSLTSWHPYTDLPRPSGGEKKAKKIEMATTLGAEKKGNDLTKQEEKMTNAPVRTAASEPGNTSQRTTETKKVELNKLCSNTVYIFN